MASEYDKKLEAARKRVGSVKGIDKKPLPKAKVKPIIKKGTVGFKVTKKFSKGGVVKGKKGC